MGTPSFENGRPGVGVAVLHKGDERALEITLETLRRQTVSPAKIVVVEDQAKTLRPDARARPEVHAWIRHDAARSLRDAALRALSSCDLAAMTSAGVALGPKALADEIDRFRFRPRLRASLTVGRRVLDLAIATDSDLSDPFATMVTSGTRLRRRAPMYFAPSMLTVSSTHADPTRFDRFTRRSDWSHAKLYIDEEDEHHRSEQLSDELGSIGFEHDFRTARETGRASFEALSLFADAHPKYRQVTKRDLGRLTLCQMEGIARGSLSAARRDFLFGLLDGLRAKAALKRRLRRDIRDLA